MHMKRLVSFIIAATVSSALAGLHAQKQSPPSLETPRASHRKDLPLARLIQPGQRLLVVEKDQAPPHVVQPYPATLGFLEWLTQVSPLVLVIRVDNSVPALTSQGDWIKSTVHATIEQSLKSTSAMASPGESVKFTQDGGEMIISGTTVRAVLPYADGFEPHQRYLVFATPLDRPTDYLIEPSTSFHLAGPNQRLMPLAHEGTIAAEQGVPLTTAVERIRAALEKAR
jgi:hypothetical protein